MTKLCGCDIVFVDPDNGLFEDGTNGTRENWTGSRKDDLKRLPLKEAWQLAKKPDGQRRTVIIYHHNTHREDGHRDEIAFWMERLPGCTVAFYARRGTARTFFIVNPNPPVLDRVTEFVRRWQAAEQRAGVKPADLSKLIWA
jgi:hypothetical protein